MLILCVGHIVKRWRLIRVYTGTYIQIKGSIGATLKVQGAASVQLPRIHGNIPYHVNQNRRGVTKYFLCNKTPMKQIYYKMNGILKINLANVNINVYK